VQSPASPLGPDDDAVRWRHHLADPSWEFRWHVPDFAEWLDARRPHLTPPPADPGPAGGLAWLGRDWSGFEGGLVVVRDQGSAFDERVISFVAATIAERARWSHRQRPETTERYVRWRMEHFDHLLERAAAEADLVLESAEVVRDLDAAAIRARELLAGD
jgi:hypothetical protein